MHNDQKHVFVGIQLNAFSYGLMIFSKTILCVDKQI